MCNAGLEEGKDGLKQGLPDGKRMRGIHLDGYDSLGVLQLDSIMNQEMKENAKTSK